MFAVEIKDLPLMEGRGKTDPTQAGIFDFPIHVGTGAASSSVTYFEVAPGEHCGRHTHSAEEILFLIEGEAELEVGSDRQKVRGPALALVPAMASHDVYNVGQTPIKVVGFFSAAGVITTFEDAFMPMDTDVFIVGMQPEPASV